LSCGERLLRYLSTPKLITLIREGWVTFCKL
jgi:hypothetical protein